MTQYIDKAAIKAELEKRIKVCQDYAKCNLTENTRIGNKAQYIELNDILSFLDTLEVKEVDLKKENLPISNSLTKEGLFTFEDGSQAIITKIN